ncbi:MAG: hypothetical protein HY337_12075, partial [Gemmatimonadetes bacterium]|nr:hypothetical protein [Gemmatimonadota bacterium]
MTSGLAIAVALLSGASLAYEVLLIRLFAIEQFHHFAAMAISIAMLGFGLSGTALALADPAAERAREWLARSSASAAPLLAVSPLLARAIPLDVARIVWDPAQWPLLAGLYVTLAAPFAAVSLAILLAIRLAVRRPGGLYGASFIGAALGSALTVAVLWLLPADRAVFLPACAAAAALIILTRRLRFLLSSLAGAAVAVGCMLGAGPDARVNPYKGLPQVTAYPEARRVAERHSPLGWLVAVRAPAFRYAPGLSLGYAGTFPQQIGLFVDGENVGAVTDPRGNGADMVGWLPAALPFALGPRRVAVLGAEGGLDVQMALAHGADSVLAVEFHPGVVELAHRLAPSDAPTPYADPRVRVAFGDARATLTRARRAFDLVMIGSAGRLGSGTGGLQALSEDFGHTVEAYVLYLRRLAPGGTLAVTQWISLPPRAAVRSILTAAAALREIGPHAAERGLVVAHGWSTVAVLARPDGFDDGTISALR